MLVGMVATEIDVGASYHRVIPYVGKNDDPRFLRVEFVQLLDKHRSSGG